MVPEGPTLPLLGLTVSQVCAGVAVKLVVVGHVSSTCCAGGTVPPTTDEKVRVLIGVPDIEIVQPDVATFMVTGTTSSFATVLAPPMILTLPLYVPAFCVLLAVTVSVAGVVPEVGETVTN